MHKTTIKEMCKDFKIRAWYEDWKKEANEERKSFSPMCLEFYVKKYPNLSENEQIELWREHTNLRKKISSEAAKKNHEKARLTPGYYKDKGVRDKETAIENIMFKSGVNKEEAEEIFRMKRVKATAEQPGHIQYWLNRGYSEKDADINSKEYNKVHSIRCVEYWQTWGLDLDEATKRVSDIQREFSVQNPHTKEFWKNVDDPYKELKRYVYCIKNNHLFSKLGYSEIEIDDKFLDAIFEDRVALTDFVKCYIESKTSKNSLKRDYEDIVRGFTKLSLPFIAGMNTEGLEIDHIYSINAGFKNNVSPEIIGSIVNLRMITKTANIKKFDKCAIKLEELLRRYQELIDGKFDIRKYDEYFEYVGGLN